MKHHGTAAQQPRHADLRNPGGHPPAGGQRRAAQGRHPPEPAGASRADAGRRPPGGSSGPAARRDAWWWWLQPPAPPRQREGDPRGPHARRRAAVARHDQGHQGHDPWAGRPAGHPGASRRRAGHAGRRPRLRHDAGAFLRQARARRARARRSPHPEAPGHGRAVGRRPDARDRPRRRGAPQPQPRAPGHPRRAGGRVQPAPAGRRVQAVPAAGGRAPAAAPAPRHGPQQPAGAEHGRRPASGGWAPHLRTGRAGGPDQAPAQPRAVVALGQRRGDHPGDHRVLRLAHGGAGPAVPQGPLGQLAPRADDARPPATAAGGARAQHPGPTGRPARPLHAEQHGGRHGGQQRRADVLPSPRRRRHPGGEHPSARGVGARRRPGRAQPDGHLGLRPGVHPRQPTPRPLARVV